MSVSRRGDIYHYDFWHNGTRYRGSTKCRKKADAQKVVERLRRDLTLGKAEEVVPSLKQVATQWFYAKVEGRRSEETTAQRVKIMLRHIDGEAPVTTIGARQVQDAIDSRRHEATRQGRAPTPSTVNRDMIDTTLRPILRFAARNLELPVRPIAWSDIRLAEPRGRTRTFTAQEIQSWRDALPEWHRPLFDFYSTYGVRLNEAFFPLDAIDFENGWVMLRERKNGTNHVLPLLPADVAAMKARAGRARAAGLNTVWFREMRDGRLTPIKPRAYQDKSKKALLKAKIYNARPVHDSRHHAATVALKRSGDLMAIKQLLGHESIQSTARYAHTSHASVLAALGHKTPHNMESDDKISNESKGQRT